MFALKNGIRFIIENRCIMNQVTGSMVIRVYGSQITHKYYVAAILSTLCIRVIHICPMNISGKKRNGQCRP